MTRTITVTTATFIILCTRSVLLHVQLVITTAVTTTHSYVLDLLPGDWLPPNPNPGVWITFFSHWPYIYISCHVYFSAALLLLWYKRFFQPHLVTIDLHSYHIDIHCVYMYKAIFAITIYIVLQITRFATGISARLQTHSCMCVCAYICAFDCVGACGQCVVRICTFCFVEFV